MSVIVDMSKYQDDLQIDWPTFSKNVDLLVLRVQYGSTVPDTQYIAHATSAVKYKVPFLTYAFPEFVSVNDARVEATDASNRKHPNSRGMVLDIESEYRNGQTCGISKLSQQVRLDGIRAYVDQLRQKGEKMVGAYIGNNVYESWNLASIVGLFDFVWIAKYSDTPPTYPCDIWQYSETGAVPGYSGPLDLSKLMGTKPLSYFTGQVTNPIIAQVRVIASALNVRQGPGPQFPVLQVAPQGKVFNVTANVNDWHEVILDNNGHKGYAYGNNGAYLELIKQ